MAENNFYKATKFATNICKLFGILPFSYVNDEIVIFKYSFIYNTLLLVLSLWLGLKVSILSFKQGDIMEAIADMTFIAVNELQLIVTFLKAIISRDKWWALAQAISKTDKLFLKMRVQLPDKTLKKRMYACVIAVMFTTCIGMALDIQLHSFETSVQYVHTHILIIFNSVLSCCIAIHVIRIRDGFEAVNSVLQERIEIERNIYFETSLKDLLCSACLVHHSLTKVMKRFSECFGIILLTTTTASFLMIVTNAYDIYKALQSHNPTVAVCTSAFCFIYIINALFLCHVCETTVEKGRMTAALIHQMHTTDYEVKDEVEMFSLQIAHTLEDFTAAKVFPINHSLVFSMTSGVSTLLIIVIQLSPK